MKKKKDNTILQDNYMMIVISSIIVGLMLLMGIVWINKGTYSIEEKTNGLIVNCPEVASPKEEIECKVYARVKDNKILSINANYKFSSEVKYISFLGDAEDNTMNILTSSQNGFVVINKNGIENVDSLFIGYLKVAIPASATPNSTYDIGLTKIEYSTDEYKMLELGDTKTSVRIKNNDATLSNIVVNGYELNKEFNKDTLEYNVAVNDNTEEVIISYTKSDSNAEVSGNGALGEKLKLHYGTNKFSLVVLSEDGSAEKEYIINVIKNYEFKISGDVYKYDKEKNTLYTKYDVNETITTNLDSISPLSDGMFYIVKDDNVLEVRYGDEAVAKVNLLRFSTEYTIDGNNKEVFIEKDLTYNKLLDKIKSETLDIKVVDQNNKVVSDNNMVINESNKLKIYTKDGVELDTYTFRIKTLSFDSSLKIDHDKKIIMKLSAGTTYSQLFSKITTSGKKEIISNNGASITESDVVKTGDKIKISFSSNDVQTYTLSVLGDVIGNGQIGVSDVDRLYRYYNSKIQHLNIYYERDKDDTAFILAGDVIMDGSIEISDVDRLYRYYNSSESVLEVEIK